MDGKKENRELPNKMKSQLHTSYGPKKKKKGEEGGSNKGGGGKPWGNHRLNTLLPAKGKRWARPKKKK